MSATVLAVDEDRKLRGERQTSFHQEPYVTSDYSETLRVIGQALESFKPAVFDIVCHDNCYLVRCLTAQQETKIRVLPTILRIWKNEKFRAAGPGGRHFRNLELLYTIEDIQFREEQGKARRRDSRGMPDPFSLPNMLRAVGWFLDGQNSSRLILASCRDLRVSIVYETSKGVRNLEGYTTPLLYDLWVNLYLRRRKPVRPTPGRQLVC